MSKSVLEIVRETCSNMLSPLGYTVIEGDSNFPRDKLPEELSVDEVAYCLKLLSANLDLFKGQYKGTRSVPEVLQILEHKLSAGQKKTKSVADSSKAQQETGSYGISTGQPLRHIPTTNAEPVSGVPHTAAPTTDQSSDNSIIQTVESVIDVVKLRTSALEMAQKIGFNKITSVKIATAVSELTRNIILYANTGRMKIAEISEQGRSGMKIIAWDRGQGISNLDEILSGNYHSTTGLGQGLRGVKSMMDEFIVSTSPETGTTVTAIKWK